MTGLSLQVHQRYLWLCSSPGDLQPRTFTVSKEETIADGDKEKTSQEHTAGGSRLNKQYLTFSAFFIQPSRPRSNPSKTRLIYLFFCSHIFFSCFTSLILTAVLPLPDQGEILHQVRIDFLLHHAHVICNTQIWLCLVYFFMYVGFYWISFLISYGKVHTSTVGDCHRQVKRLVTLICHYMFFLKG